jgi:hypothetical protein
MFHNRLNMRGERGDSIASLALEWMCYFLRDIQYVDCWSWAQPPNDFSYMSLRITFIGSTNFLCFPTTTGRRLQPPSFSGYNPREAPTPQFSGYNQKEATIVKL